MIVTWDDARDRGHALQATPEAYDAFPPVNALVLDDLPRMRDPDRVALASYLAFGAWSSGSFVVPHDLSPTAAEAIEADARPLPIRPCPVEYAARALPRTFETVDVRFRLSPEPAEHPVLAVVPNTLAHGVFRTNATTIVPSNAFVLDSARASVGPCIRARLAVAVLFAEDVGASALRIADAVSDAAELARLQALTRSVNLDVCFV